VPQKVDEADDLSNPVALNSVPTPQVSKVVKNDNVIASEMFRINPSKTSRKDKFVPINKVRASVRTNPITVSQPHVITKNHINSDSHGLSFTGVDNTTKTRRPQPRSNTKNDRVPSAFKSSCIKKEVVVEEHHRNLLLSKNKKPMSFVVPQVLNKINLGDQNISPLKITITQNYNNMIISKANDSQELPDEIYEKLQIACHVLSASRVYAP
nr:hypothetical protein [Tanacetum cinerariifolium]